MAAQLSHRAGNEACWPEPGQTYRDPVGGAVLLVLAAPCLPGVLCCGGVPMVDSRPLPCGYHARPRAGTGLLPGRRYCDIVSGLEVRCLRVGPGYLTFAGRPLSVV
jgi:hypothetical protein